jgi:hypothetical protein
MIRKLYTTVKVSWSKWGGEVNVGVGLRFREGSCSPEAPQASAREPITSQPAPVPQPTHWDLVLACTEIHSMSSTYASTWHLYLDYGPP